MEVEAAKEWFRRGVPGAGVRKNPGPCGAAEGCQSGKNPREPWSEQESGGGVCDRGWELRAWGAGGTLNHIGPENLRARRRVLEDQPPGMWGCRRRGGPGQWAFPGAL